MLKVEMNKEGYCYKSSLHFNRINVESRQFISYLRPDILFNSDKMDFKMETEKGNLIIKYNEGTDELDCSGGSLFLFFYPSEVVEGMIESFSISGSEDKLICDKLSNMLQCSNKGGTYDSIINIANSDWINNFNDINIIIETDDDSLVYSLTRKLIGKNIKVYGVKA